CPSTYTLIPYKTRFLSIGASAAMWAVVFFAWGPLGALFQVGYAEMLFLLLLLIALDLVSRRRFVWLYAVIPVMAFTRPGILAFADRKSTRLNSSHVKNS